MTEQATGVTGGGYLYNTIDGATKCGGGVYSTKVCGYNNDLIDKDTKDKMELGTYMHYLFEVFDFNNPDYSFVDEKYKKYLEMFLNSGIDFSGKIYKEYEFIYACPQVKVSYSLSFGEGKGRMPFSFRLVWKLSRRPVRILWP